ncbi:MAG: DUF4351 domain-containing protein [Methylococcales bacterium]
MDRHEAVLVYKWPRMTRDEVRNMLGEIFHVELKQTRFYQDVFREGEMEGKKEGRKEGRIEGLKEGQKEGRKEGLKEGHQEGQKEGRHQGERLVLRRMLVKRFGALPEWAEQRLNDADIAQLEQWTDRILDASALNEVFINEES